MIRSSLVVEFMPVGLHAIAELTLGKGDLQGNWQM